MRTSTLGRPPRGIAYWPGEAGSPAEIAFGTYDGFLLAVDAKSGKPIAGFGNNGEIDLKTGMMNGHPEAHYGLSAAPVIYKNLVITGSHTQDAPSIGPRGDLRAWDVRIGKLIWTFHSIPEPGRTRPRNVARRWLEKSIRHQRLDHLQCRCHHRHRVCHFRFAGGGSLGATVWSLSTLQPASASGFSRRSITTFGITTRPGLPC